MSQFEPSDGRGRAMSAALDDPEWGARMAKEQRQAEAAA